MKLETISAALQKLAVPTRNSERAVMIDLRLLIRQGQAELFRHQEVVKLIGFRDGDGEIDDSYIQKLKTPFESKDFTPWNHLAVGNV